MRAWWLVLCLVWASGAQAQPARPLAVALLPTLSAKALLTQYQPLRIYLERELRRPVDMVTAPDFRRFHADTLAGEFDLALSAAHLARHAQTEAGLLPLATYDRPNHPVLVMAASRPVSRPEALRGQTLAVFDPLALVVLQARHWLEDQGLHAGRDYRVAVFPSHASVAHAVNMGEALLGVTASVGLGQYTAEMKQQVHVFTELPAVPALIWLAHPRHAAQAEALKGLLLRFGQSSEGQQFFAQSGYRSMRPLRGDELLQLDRPAREASHLLKGAR